MDQTKYRQDEMFGGSLEPSQAQRAGDASLQIQAGGDVNLGLSESRAREIALDTAKQVVSEFTEEANSIIQERILKLDDRVIASLIRENRLHVFADPGFQRTYRKAQEGAAVSDRDSDYDLLAALVADRAERGSVRLVRAGIERAIEIIDRVDDEALRALTVLQAVAQYRPAGGDVEMGLQVMDRLLGQLLDGPLPRGSDWLDHLDMLDAVRHDPTGSMRKFQEYWPTVQMPGYMSSGVEKSIAPETFVLGLVEFPWLTVPHQFKDGYVRIKAATKDDFESYYAHMNPEIRKKLSDEADSIFNLSTIDESCREPLMKLIRAIPTLNEIERWWDELPGSVSVTAAGRVLARANAERLDIHDILPPLN